MFSDIGVHNSPFILFQNISEKNNFQLIEEKLFCYGPHHFKQRVFAGDLSSMLVRSDFSDKGVGLVRETLICKFEIILFVFYLQIFSAGLVILVVLIAD